MAKSGDKKQKGFTIVELLIVIVIIAILAAISIVAYNGIQERAKNSQTIAAVGEWVQLLRMYKADNGEYPLVASCLGTGYGKGFSGNESSGSECRQDSAGGGGINASVSFMNLFTPYTNGTLPTPAFVTGSASEYPWYRGAYFYQGYTGSKDRIDFVLAGSSTECPSIAGMTGGTAIIFPSMNSVMCRVRFEDSKY